MQKELQAVLASFAVFLLGIVVFALCWPYLQTILADDRLVMLSVLSYLVLLRLAGRWLARRLCSRV